MTNFDIVLPLVLSTFGVVFFAELPDKTALASLTLATRYPARQVIAGAWLAFLAQTLIAVAAGSVLQLLPAQPVRIAAGIGFFVFAVLAARRDVDAEQKEEEHVAEAMQRRTRSPWLACFLVVFAAEFGDVTQLATAALVAQSGQPLSVGVGALLALWSVTLLAVFAGSRLAGVLQPRVLKWISVVLFAAVGLIVLASALRTET